MELIQNAVTQNPQLKQLVDQYGGGDPKTAFYEYAKKTGQDPEQIINMMKKFMK